MSEEESCYPGNGGKPRLLSEQCETCIFRPGNPMHLKEGRLMSMVQAASREGSQGIICHDTLSYGDHPDYGGALCRGYYDSYGHLNNFIRVMGRLGGFQEVPPPRET
jgi:hypothetical protein